jgi:hypothetical protein
VLIAQLRSDLYLQSCDLLCVVVFIQNCDLLCVVVLIAQLQLDLYLRSCNLLCVAPLDFGLHLVVLAICSVFPHWVLGFGFRSTLFFHAG